MEHETWKDIIDFIGYQVSDHGNVRSFHSWRGKPVPRLLKQVVAGRTATKHAKVLLNNRCGKRKGVYVHKLVLEAFVCARPHKMECCHIDGNPTNNRVNNLRWDTTKNNWKDRIQHGTTNRGEQNPNSKLTANDVILIRKDTRSLVDIGKHYGVDSSTIGHIKKRRGWAWL